MTTLEPEVVEKPKGWRKYRLGLWGPVAIVLIAAAWLVWTLRPVNAELELYVTPPFDNQGTRIELLKPHGWEPVDWGLADKSVWNSTQSGIRFISLNSADRFGGWPEWLQLRLPEGCKDSGSIVVNVFPATGRRGMEYKGVELLTDKADAQRTTWNSYTDGKYLNKTYLMAISYNRTDKSRFDSTHSEILQSIKLHKEEKAPERSPGLIGQ